MCIPDIISKWGKYGQFLSKFDVGSNSAPCLGNFETNWNFKNSDGELLWCLWIFLQECRMLRLHSVTSFERYEKVHFCLFLGQILMCPRLPAPSIHPRMPKNVGVVHLYNYEITQKH